MRATPYALKGTARHQLDIVLAESPLAVLMAQCLARVAIAIPLECDVAWRQMAGGPRRTAKAQRVKQHATG